MSYIVCRNCKKFVEVDENVPLNFDKCDNCGHTLEFASNDTELNMMLNNIFMPKLSYTKICASCNSLNPRETGACLHCGSTNLRLEYDLDSFNDSQQMHFPDNLNDSQQMHFQDNLNKGVNTRTIIIRTGPSFSPKNSLIFRSLSLLVGLIDFFFFSLLGIQFIMGSSEIPSDLMAFATQNMYPLMGVIGLSLILSGIMSVMIIPRMSYKDSLETSSTIGIAVGLITLIATRDIVTVIVSIVFCSLLAGFGGLIGEFIIHKLSSRFKP